MRVYKHKRVEPQIYRVVTTDGPRYIRGYEVVPGLLVHPDVTDLDCDLGEDLACWTITHKDSGRSIATCVFEKHLAIRACRKLNALANADGDASWLNLQKDWVEFGRAVRLRLPFAETWPKELG